MSHSLEDIPEDDFKWGAKINVITNNKDVNLYRSCIYQGVKYSLYDCVCLFREGTKETDIGKIIKMWERKQEKRLRILWFFRPSDIRSFLRDYEPSWNELFLASGVGKGLCNIVPMEAIVGKCNVICTSKDSRNTLPSMSDLGKAEYFFSHTFDVGNLKIMEKFPDKVDVVRVEHLFNQKKDKAEAVVECMNGITAGALANEKDCQVGIAETQLILKDSIVNDESSRTSEDFKQHISENQPLKKRKIQLVGDADSADLVQPSVDDPKSILDPLPNYGTKSPPNNRSESYDMHQSNAVGDKETSQPAKRTAVNKVTRSWFYKLPWGEKVKNANERGTLVCLNNLDPSSTASDIQDVIKKAFKVEASAKITPGGSFSSASYGEALVVFNSKNDADFVIQGLSEKCLLAGGRPVVPSRKSLGDLEKITSFPGHLTIEKVKKMKWGENQKNAVFTSHCSQPNTIPYNMATQWRVLQAKSDLWWKTLHEEQAKELSKYENQLKRHQISENAAGSSSKGRK